MLVSKEDPSDGEIVLCTVRKILKTTVFVDLEEFENKEGIIHISEISPGRIRTIRDYVKENKKIVCKVLRKNPKYNNIELSIRRVTTGQRIKKLQEIKLENKAEQIIKTLEKLTKQKLFGKITTPVLKEYGSLFHCFQEVATGDITILTELGIDKKIAEELEKIIKQRFKPHEVTITKKLSLKCPTEKGVESIKKSLKKAREFAEKNKYISEFIYVGAPNYSIKVTAENYKTAEEEIEEILNDLSTALKKEKGFFEIL